MTKGRYSREDIADEWEKLTPAKKDELMRVLSGTSLYAMLSWTASEVWVKKHPPYKRRGLKLKRW